MKILQLLEALITPTQTNKTFNGTLRSRYETGRKASNRELGNGGFSAVKPHSKDPHMVKKHNTGPAAAEIDGYNVYVGLLVDHDLMDNPHFPRVYNATQIKDKKGNFINTFDIEKLEDFMHLSPEDAEAIVRNHFQKGVIDIDPKWFVDGESYFLADVIADRVHDALYYGDFSQLKGKFAEAVQTLNKIFHDEGLIRNLDMHSGNVMMRRTPHGPQLVITDPLA